MVPELVALQARKKLLLPGTEDNTNAIWVLIQDLSFSPTNPGQLCFVAALLTWILIRKSSLGKTETNSHS